MYNTASCVCLLLVVMCTLLVVRCVHNDLMPVSESMTNHNHHTRHNKPSTPPEHPCRTKLTDEEYLQHMIPHHRVAVDVSVQHIKRTKNDMLANVLRTLIWTQQYEIHLMQTALRRPVAHVSDIRTTSESVQSTTFSYLYPNRVGLSKTACDPHFFDPVAHRAHAEMMVTDKAYIEHMIPHHQVAVDMSKRLLEHTRSDFMTYLAYRIIRSQEAEIKLLHDLKSSDVRRSTLRYLQPHRALRHKQHAEQKEL